MYAYLLVVRIQMSAAIWLTGIVNLSHFVQKIGSFSFHNLLIIQHSGCKLKVEK